MPQPRVAPAPEQAPADEPPAPAGAVGSKLAPAPYWYFVATFIFNMIATAVAVGLLWQGHLSRVGLWLFGIFYVITATGMHVGFHRKFSHHSFKAHKLVTLGLGIAGSMALVGSPIFWVALHRRHHQFSDREGDPHSPMAYGHGVWNRIRGLGHAHCGWLLDRELGRTHGYRYVRDLLTDRTVVFIEKTYIVWVLLGIALPTAIGWWWEGGGAGALHGLLYGGIARIAIVQHIGWAVNSIGHTFGRRDYDVKDDSTNDMFSALFIDLGEGWHNNHHAFPTSARHGIQWWQIDLNWYFIRTLELVGLAWDVQRPKDSLIARKAL